MGLGESRDKHQRITEMACGIRKDAVVTVTGITFEPKRTKNQT